MLMGDDYGKSLCSDCSRRDCKCPKKTGSDSGFSENVNNGNVSDDKGDSGDDDKGDSGDDDTGDLGDDDTGDSGDDDKGDSEDDEIGDEDKDNEANAVLENFRMFFTTINSPPAKALPRPQWIEAKNEKNPRLLKLGSRVIHVNQRAWTNSLRADADEEKFGTTNLAHSDSQSIENSDQPPSNTTSGNAAISRDSTTVAEFFKHFAFSGSQSTSYRTAPGASGSNDNTKFNSF